VVSDPQSEIQLLYKPFGFETLLQYTELGFGSRFRVDPRLARMSGKPEAWLGEVIMNMLKRRYVLTVLVLGMALLLGESLARAAVASKAAKAKAAKAAKEDKSRKLDLWERAAAVYKTASDVYRLGDWKKASPALAGFIKQYPTSETIPLAMLQLADCQFRMGDAVGGDKTLDECIKKFPAAKTAFYAYSYRLHRQMGKKKYDDFFKTYQSLIKLMGQAPMSLHPRLDWRTSGDYYWRFGNVTVHWPYKRRLGYSLNFAPTNYGWAGHLLKIGNNPKRAAKLLRILGPTLKKVGKDLPIGWKYVHIMLLRNADKGRTADVQYKKYLAQWPKGDPRRMGLMLFEAQWAQAQSTSSGPRPKPAKGQARDKNAPPDYRKRADDIYAALIKAYPAWDTLGARLPSRINYLLRQRRYDEFATLAQWYLDKYPAGSWRNTCVNLWIKLARTKAAMGDASQIPAVIKMLEEEAKTYPLNPQAMRSNIVRRVDLYMAIKQADKALATAKLLTDPKLWSAETFGQIKTLAGRYSAMRPVEDEVRQRYDIFPTNSSSKALGLLNKLRYRISQDKVRFMDEIASEMFEKHYKDAHTVEAMKMMVEYYFKKALPEQRNKWASLMVKGYKYHPLTQRALQFQIDAENGAKNFPALARVAVKAMDRFPAANAWNRWFNHRIRCFHSIKDYKGAAAFAKQRLGERAATGENFAIRRIGDTAARLRGSGSFKDQGDYWMAQASKWTGKYQEIYCLRRALGAYYFSPCSRWWWNQVNFPGAVKAARAMRKQRLSPELRWKTQFDDINLMAQGSHGKVTLKYLLKRLKTNSLSFHISELLDLANVGMAIGKDKLAVNATRAITQLRDRCKKTKIDNHEFAILMGNMLRNEGKAIKAAGAFVRAAKYYHRPIDRWVLQINAINCLAREGKQIPLISQYAASIKTAQDMVPRLLQMAGNYYAAKTQTRKQAMSYLAKLRKLYPASAQRGALEEKLKK